MAEHLETVQWCRRQTTQRAPFAELLPVCGKQMTDFEICREANALRVGRARRNGTGIVMEYLKGVLQEGCNGSQWEIELCQKCWESKTTSVGWHLARVKTLCRKGGETEGENHRPIRIICVLDKLCAYVLRDRLREGGVEERLTISQFGFRQGRGTLDAL